MRESGTGAVGDNKAHFGLSEREPWLFIIGKSEKMERNLPQNIVALEKSCTFAPLQTKEASVRDVSRGQKRKGAHSSAGLEHLSYKQRVIGSNPIGPTPLQRKKALPHREQIFTIITLFGEGS